MQSVEGSERAQLPGSVDVGAADPNERLEVTLLLRRGQAEELKDRVAKLDAGDRSEPPLSREAFADRYGGDPADVAAVQAVAAKNGLVVVSTDLGRRAILLSGTVTQFNQAFGVELRRFEHANGSYRGRTGAVHLPDELIEVVQAVLGLDNRPQASPHYRGRQVHANILRRADAAAALIPSSFSPVDLASLYDFPVGDGAGECVAIIELGGGYRPEDLATYFSNNGLATAPTVLSVSVDHAQNAPAGNPQSDDGEVMLDIEVVGCIAPKAQIAVYFAPNTDAGFIDAVSVAAHDAVNKPSIISISWGGSESNWTAQSMTAFDEALQAAAVMGVTVCIASGDNGSSDGVPGGDHVNFPASSPHALACGGTTIQASGGAITSEAVWNDTSFGGGASGGGVSAFFALPPWQAKLVATKTSGGQTPLSGRGVPDVSGDADPETGYRVRVDGEDTTYGGTSAVAPLWAGLLARINAIKGQPVGFINPLLYGDPAALKDIVDGNNGDFSAAVGWDACTGLGSPDGASVAAVLGAV